MRRDAQEIGHKKGHEKGLKEGRMEGHREGLEEGIQKGHRAGVKASSMDIARNLWEAGASLDLITKTTGISPDEIKKLVAFEV